eukprot:767782-Hanusia_phi.AAC.1
MSAKISADISDGEDLLLPWSSQTCDLRMLLPYRTRRLQSAKERILPPLPRRVEQGPGLRSACRCSA